MNIKIESLKKEPFQIFLNVKEAKIQNEENLRDLLFQSFALIFNKSPSFLKVLDLSFLPISQIQFTLFLEQDDPYRWKISLLDLEKKFIAHTEADIDIGADLGC